MLFSHDTERSLACIVDLVNSAPSTAAEDQLGRPRGAARRSWSGTTSARWASSTGRDLRGRAGAARAWSAAVFDAADDRSAAPAVNTLVSQAAVTPRLTDHDGYDWHVHYFTPGASPGRAPQRRLRDGAGPRRRLRGARAAAPVRGARTASRSSSTCPATAPSATATPAPAATACTSRPTASASAPPAPDARHGSTSAASRAAQTCRHSRGDRAGRRPARGRRSASRPARRGWWRPGRPRRRRRAPRSARRPRGRRTTPGAGARVTPARQPAASVGVRSSPSTT